MPEQFRPEHETAVPNLSSWLNPDRPDDVPPGEAFDAWSLRIKSPEELESLPTKEKLLYFSWFANLAANTHNAVPWRFELSEEHETVRLWVDRKFILPASDKVGRQATISMGCCIENLVRAAQTYGRTATIQLETNDPETFLPFEEWENQEEQVKPFATIRFEQTGQGVFDESDLKAVLKRKVFRGQMDNRHALTPELKEVLRSIFMKHPTLTRKVASSYIEKGLFSIPQETSMLTVLNLKQFRDELGKNMNADSDTETPRGMRPREFGLRDTAGERFFKGLQVGATEEEMLTAFEILGFARTERNRIVESSSVIFLSSDDTIMDRVEAGRTYEEMAIELLKLDIYTSVHAAVTEVNEVSDNSIVQKFFGGKRPTVIFRMGKPLDQKDIQTPHASRPSMSELLVGIN